MTTTAFTGPLSTFTQKLDGTSSGYSDQGYALMSQRVSLTQNSTTAVTGRVDLPQGSQITGFNIDVTTAYDSATSATLTIGTAAAGTQYVGAVDAKTAGRAAPTLSAAQLTAMQNITTNHGVFVTVTPVGATTAGAVTVTVFYVQQPQAGDTP
ncbi:hypothetical protein [Rhizobium lusitanum]|uniref:Uncharacterized protein n=1 Tax=Rhizobium lusitanum TaxID=293958 RepID=A0A1C3VR99_9HYPH|nr:hypothetical protein [Rhizobium lusitanum]SCB30316.1 hypothetical protein GA0061101_10691 [Rhizobium lusitanum]